MVHPGTRGRFVAVQHVSLPFPACTTDSARSGVASEGTPLAYIFAPKWGSVFDASSGPQPRTRIGVMLPSHLFCRVVNPTVKERRWQTEYRQRLPDCSYVFANKNKYTLLCNKCQQYKPF